MQRENVRSLINIEVLAPHTGEGLGLLADVLIDPEEGEIIGLVVEGDDHRPGMWLVEEFKVNGEMVIASSDLMKPMIETVHEAKAISVVKDIIGAKVVTTHGEFLGHVSDAGFSSEGRLAIFRITRSFFQKIFRRGLFIKSDIPKSYFKDGSDMGARLIVPSDIIRLQS